MKKYVIGLDGGGTSTKGVLLDEKGQVCADSIGPSSNIQAIGDQELTKAFEQVILDLIAKAGIEKNKVSYLYAGLAGAGRPADRERISACLSSLDLVKDFTIDTDAMAALAGAFNGKAGIILISGTGAICFGKDENDNVVRCGGWGFLLGDEGSGFYFGQQAIIAALKDLDGRGEKTILGDKIKEFFGLEKIELIISPIYSNEIDRTKIASLAPIVFEEAAKNDKVAAEIVETAGKELGKVVAGVSKNLGMTGKSVSVALIGSVFNQRDTLIPLMSVEATKVVSQVTFIDPQNEPAVGAAILGLKKIGISPDELN